MATPSVMEREAAQNIAASFVGSWHGTGSVGGSVNPCCGTVEAWYNIHPVDASNKHVMAGYARLRCCGVCNAGRLELKGARSASGLSFTSYCRNVDKAEWEHGGAPVNLTGTLTSVDASKLTMQFRLDGDQSGTCVMDGKSMTETINRSSVAGRFVLKSSKVADAPKKILICGCCAADPQMA
mmetsp:Transcript_7461/g.12650  ORF Transcript_7461/g.12650 Transcript_7461/m.12650 type:complete len:182 (-) Transcript_7461:132-677(-)|eukprot:CAMPEP_0119334390 /NCGR_PEP_ID=MMETSP1333-20130426/87257_1 /TAXON_ID=418940 /ORGANISM="Scyphosphaera apsteinii, Strain RCC1455" /LENGTH=181 /DNA_ID=CAMNT_0007344677 /DNA_START=114 /DNA_END=659 /DNA_ORIENTATION=+